MWRLVSVRAEVTSCRCEHAGRMCHADNRAPCNLWSQSRRSRSYGPQAAMPTLRQLPPAERKEFARSMAKELYSALDGCNDDVDGYGKRAYRQLAESGLLHEENFYGERLNEAQLDLLKTFHGKYHEAWSYGEAYDKHIAPLEKAIPGFAFSSELLRRAWCMKLFLNELNRDTCPFGSMLVFEAVDDRDRTDESNDENDDMRARRRAARRRAAGAARRRRKGRRRKRRPRKATRGDSDESDSDGEEEGGDNAEPPPKRVKPVRACERKPEPEPENGSRGLMDSDSDSD